MEDNNQINEKDVQEQTEQMIKKLYEMSKEELDDLYLKFKKETELLEIAERLNDPTKAQPVKEADLSKDDICKTVFGSCLASMIGGVTLGALAGQNMREFMGIAFLGTVYGTIFVSLLSECVRGSKPVKKMINAIKKCALKREIAKIDKQKKEYAQVKDLLQQPKNLGVEKV